MTVVLVVIARVPPEGVPAFQRFEAIVLPLLDEHGGTLEDRFRNEDGTLEVQVVEFSTKAALEAFRADPRREAAAPLIAESKAVIEVTEVRRIQPR